MVWPKAIFAAVAAVLNYFRQRSEANNAPDVKAAAKAKLEQERKEIDERATRERDLKRTREQLAE